MCSERKVYPIIDLHCDLLCYLIDEKDGHPWNEQEIGCSVPALKAGEVRLQVLAAYTATESGSVDYVAKQVGIFEKLLSDFPETFQRVSSSDDVVAALRSEKIGIVISIENASGLLEDGEHIDKAFARLEEIVETTGRVFYVSLTHHGENRFCGGNASDAGLKEDGRIFLEQLSGRKIAVDLSHTNDASAHDILDHIDRMSLDIPLLASHSNFRAVCNHPRNLSDRIAGELIRRNGLIGMNFLRAFLHPDDPAVLLEHINHGMQLGGRNALCFGADFYCTKDHPDRERVPFYFPEHENAGKYQEILHDLQDGRTRDDREALAFGNALDFMKRVWG